MEVLIDTKLVDFEFWAGAKDNAFLLTYDELDRLEGIIEDLFVGTPTETQINDLFWFEFDLICDWLELTDEDFNKRRKRI